jgi:hypothetical protein
MLKMPSFSGFSDSNLRPPAAHVLEPLSALNSGEHAEDAIPQRHQRPSVASAIPTYGRQRPTSWNR